MTIFRILRTSSRRKFQGRKTDRGCTAGKMGSGTASTQATQVLYLAFNFCSTIAVTFINKAVFSRVQFGYVAALCNIHYTITWLGVEIMRRMGLFEPLKKKPSLREVNFAVMVVVIGLVTPLNNSALKLNSMGFYQIVKLMVTPCVVLLEYLLDAKILSWRRAACLVAVCTCVLISSRAALEFSTKGAMCSAMWLPLAATYKVQWGRVRKQYSASTMAMMHVTLPYAIVVQAAVSPLFDPPGLLEFVWTPSAVFWIGLSGIAAFLVNFSGFLVMGNIGALAHVLLGQLKTSVIMVGAYFVFNSKYSSVQLMGAFGAVMAIVAYTHVTVEERKTKQDDIAKPVITDEEKSELTPVKTESESKTTPAKEEA